MSISPFELKQLRKAIGANTARMKQLLGLPQNTDLQALENGSQAIPQSVDRLAKYMQCGVSEGVMSNILPKFLICDDMESNINHEWIFHTRYPRFLAIVTDKPIDGINCASRDNIEWLSVAMWIDEPVADHHSYLNEAAKYFFDYTQESSL